MTSIELNPDELTLMREALHAFLDDFGHEEIDVVQRIMALLARLSDAGADPAA